ncbi:MarR family transcriptional regulator [Cohnella zeiphila]|uniref:MarR family transcriptional regulator n=1 Tax=Cohnella zeiphila TaxID=2761120 RepID=A0A7X0SN65_9BACL|nr:MarR family transcriptional regulator [Cohnella zeiphila]
MAKHEDLVELFGLIRLHTRLWRNEWEKDNPQDISFSQLQTLDILMSEGPRPSTYLSQMLGVTSGGMTVISDKLVRQELAQRISDANDRRVVKLEITEAGKAALEEAQEKRIALMEKLFNPLTEDEVHSMVLFYRKLTDPEADKLIGDASF